VNNKNLSNLKDRTLLRKDQIACEAISPRQASQLRRHMLLPVI
jgi:hypothetical protein